MEIPDKSGNPSCNSRRQFLLNLGIASAGSAAATVGGVENTFASPKSIQADVLIIGGGTAGTIAAIQAGRLGVRTILVEAGSQLGGTTTTAGVDLPGLFHAWGRQIIAGTVPTIPLGALIPRSSRDVMAAGRCISSDRLANSALRVQASCMAMGQAAGVTCALAAQMNLTPAQVPLADILKTLREQGAITPA